ncbi:phosphoribosylaminoimidazolesuccinocarboxamide synthase [Homoserinibacter sp. GY 40078]|uniref:phosphoribosylaminoimidazolesuccinocarboxamide synthase n=1 Tax=Homoserinibacter sp. GY 40078 TaxID=2603275 RepID=UPI0011C9B530|nr:phosphoribosylaminoimidazolesuccinocarboxamide synthase [Homoserinibacter sp. GY 40078]TXK18728.1 phosphoribosylaminoimidazolesuccinocarboxamide synthase [Homoserinibacter sp. GY 40078]
MTPPIGSADPRLEAAGWRHEYSGKVRDLYLSDDEPGRALVVASDRVSAFDHVLDPGIPGKGALLTRLSLWWFAQLAGVPNHLVEPTRGGLGALAAPLPDDIAERAMLVKRLDMFPIECVVRGYLVGSGWAEYQAAQTVCGIPLPAGLGNGDRLPDPIYTPAYKAPMGEHDENITFERTVELVGEADAAALRTMSLAVFDTASVIAESRGVILADTKFEFGRDPESGEITLADEVLTSDSSRYWDASLYAAGGADRLDSFDKQIVRNWLSANWDGSGIPPTLPVEIVERTAARYRELLTRLTA